MVPVFIRAVPWDERRAANARALRHQTGGRIVWDLHRSGYETFLDALRFACGQSAIHLEDDIFLTSDWRAKAEAVIAEHADEVVQLFSSNTYGNLHVGSRYEPGRTFRWTQCFYVPVRLSVPLHAFAKTWALRDHPGSWYDTMMSDCLKEEKERFWQQVPGLVQHRAWSSVIGPRSTHRQSKTFVP